MTATILALDSASSICSVALLTSELTSHELFAAHHEGTAQHAERILPLVEEVLLQSKLKRQDLDAIVFAQGPGGFTGLRVACGVAQGIAYALDIPVVPISSLLVVAAQQEKPEEHDAIIEIVVADARMSELYVGAFQRTHSGWYRLHKPVLFALDQLYDYLKQLLVDIAARRQNTQLRLSGDGLLAFSQLVSFAKRNGILVGNSEQGRVQTLAYLGKQDFQYGRSISPSLAAPLYVRNRVAFTTAEREIGLGGNPSAQRKLIEIRSMQYHDLSDVAAIEKQLQLKPWSYTQFEQSLEAGYLGWVAFQDQQLIAYVLMMPNVDEAELLIIGVAPKAQRQGVAQQLLCFAEQSLRAQGAKKIHLEVRATNLKAIALYEGAEYYPVGLRKNYYAKGPDTPCEDAILFTKQLA